MENKKPISEWTLGEVKSYCSNRNGCKGCKFWNNVAYNGGSELRTVASSWQLNDTEKDMTGAATEASDKPAKPRLAEILGVEVGERFKMGEFPELVCITEDGDIVSTGSGAICSKWITDAINHPESIIRIPRLTEAEFAICKVLGAKWVERENGDFNFQVSLWRENPKSATSVNEQNAIWLGRVRSELFPSVHPGDCICVEEADK